MTISSLSRIIGTAFIVALSVGGVFTFHYASVRAQTDTGSSTTGSGTGTSGTGTGLSGSQYAACTGEILSLFQGDLEEQAKHQAEQALNEALKQFEDNIGSYVICIVQSLLNNLGILGDSTGGGSECSIPMPGPDSAAAKAKQKEDEARSLVASCTATTGVVLTEDLATNMLQNQGPGGGPAWVTDWVATVYVDPDRQAMRRFWSLLVNTNICPQFRDQALNYFGVPSSYRNTPPNVSSLAFRVNADDPFTLRGACTLPKDYDPTQTGADAFIKNGGFSFLQTMSEPQNNLLGFIGIANAELTAQRETLVQGMRDQVVAGGGFLPIYGSRSASCQESPDGEGCIDYGRIKQPPGGTRDIVLAQNQADFALEVQANGINNKAVTDLSARIQSRFADLANSSLPLHLELGPDSTNTHFTPAPTPPVDNSPGSGGPQDPVCTGGNPGCTCVTNDSSAKTLSQTLIKNAILKAMNDNQDLFDPPGSNQIAAGVDPRTVLAAICTSLGSDCLPHPTNNNEIVVHGIAIEVITPEGQVRTDGGTPTRICDPGIQN